MKKMMIEDNFFYKEVTSRLTQDDYNEEEEEEEETESDEKTDHMSPFMALNAYRLKQLFLDIKTLS